MKKIHTKNHHALFINGFWVVIFVLAVYSRLFQLDLIPFDTFEAQYALEILNLRSGNAFVFSNPLGFSIIRILLLVFGNHPWVFRLIPSLSGVVIVVLPFFLQQHLGENFSLGLSVLLLLDPFLAGNSRLIYGNAFPLMCLFLLLFSILNGRSVWIGIWLGLGFISGLSFLKMVMLIVFALIVFNFINKEDQVFTKTLGKYSHALELKNIVLGLFYCVGSYFLVSAITESNPLAILNQLPILPNVWTMLAKYFEHFSIKLLSLFSYAFPVWMAGMVFGIIGLRHRRRMLVFFLLLQAFATLAVLIIPFFTALDFLFALLPASISTVLGMEILLKDYKLVDEKSLLLSISVLIVLTAFIWLSLLRIISMSWNPQIVWSAFFSILITIALMFIISLFFIQFGKVPTIKYSIWGTLGVFLIIIQFASVSRITGISSTPAQEIMLAGEACAGMNELENVLVEIENLNLSKGDNDRVDISSELPCEFYSLTTLDIIPDIKTPIVFQKPIVITENLEFEQKNDSYARMIFSSTAYPEWKVFGLQALKDISYWRWFFLRQGKLTQSFSYLWIKNDFLQYK